MAKKYHFWQRESCPWYEKIIAFSSIEDAGVRQPGMATDLKKTCQISEESVEDMTYPKANSHI